MPAAVQKRETILGTQAFGARASVMGGIAAGEDASGLYWNPAIIGTADQGYGFVYGRNEKFGLKNWFEEQFAFVLPSKGALRWGGFFLREQVGLNQGIASSSTVNVWKTGQWALGGSLRVRPKLLLGATLGTVNVASAVGDETLSNTAVSGSIGLLADFKTLQVGMSCRNLAVSKQMALVPNFGLGIAWPRENALFQLELNTAAVPGTKEHAWGLSGGMEFEFRPGLSLRIGVGPVQKDQPLGIKAGLGVVMGGWLVDYAYDLRPAGSTHNISSGLRF
mgnify:CR=1 FL=1